MLKWCWCCCNPYILRPSSTKMRKETKIQAIPWWNSPPSNSASVHGSVNTSHHVNPMSAWCWMPAWSQPDMQRINLRILSPKDATSPESEQALPFPTLWQGKLKTTRMGRQDPYWLTKWEQMWSGQHSKTEQHLEREAHEWGCQPPRSGRALVSLQVFLQFK